MTIQRRALAVAWLVALVTAGVAGSAMPAASPVLARGEWPTYGGTHANARYSPLDQINRDNVQQLRIAWRWSSPDRELMAARPGIQTWANEATPLMVGGVLYVSTSASQVAAIDARTGRTLWVHDPKIWTVSVPRRAWLCRTSPMQFPQGGPSPPEGGGVEAFTRSPSTRVHGYEELPRIAALDFAEKP